MKKLFVASALALALTAASQQTASAWCEFKFSAGVNLSYRSSGSCTNFGIYRQSTPINDCCPFPCAGDAFPYYGGHAAVQGAESYYGGYAAQTPAAQPYNPYYNSGYQPASYSFPGSYYQAPTYWYGR